MKGRVTIPTDRGFVEGTKEIMKKWGADAVRDCDGTELPENPKELADKVYKTYFLARGDNDFAYAHDEYLQNIALISERKVATEKTLRIFLLEDYYSEQMKVNFSDDPKEFWQVFDRTSGREINAWEYDEKTDEVIISDAEYMHEYTVSFFAKAKWDPTQIYNYTCNGWTCVKDRDVDPVFPAAVENMKKSLKKWLEENKDISVIRFTTFFYHFFLVHKRDSQQKYFDWFGYAMTASPEMFRLFEKEYGYKIKIEDIVDDGYYSNNFREPTKRFKDYRAFVEKFVTGRARIFTDIVHEAGREAMMFLGDNWIGAEIYGEHFKDIDLDAVVGSVNSGATLRMLSEIKGVRYTEARFLPYFFPDTLANEEDSVAYLERAWTMTRRAMLRCSVDRIGFGGYLKLAARFPKFVAAAANLCDEFRTIYNAVSGDKPYCAVKVAILNSWGKIRSWQNHMVCQDAPMQKIQNYQGILEILSGLPVDVEFINFDDVKEGKLKKYDVVFNYGDAGTAFVGDWTDGEVQAKVREFVYSGGGFIGIGEPTALPVGKSKRYFALADVLGVDRETSLSLIEFKYNYEKADSHFITADAKSNIDFGNDLSDVYALDKAEVLDIKPDKYFGVGISCGHVRLAANNFGKGRAVYFTGLKYNSENSRLLYRAMLYAAGKENLLEKAYSTDVNTECHYYPESGQYAVVNNSDKDVITRFYDIDGNSEEVKLSPRESKFITRK